MILFRHATVITPDTAIPDGALLIDGERIIAVGGPETALPDAAAVVDASGLVITPGFLDLQVNGGFGLDFTADPATIWQVAAGLPRYGVTSFLPTIITSPPATVRAAQAVMQAGPPDGWQGARPLGLHLEGPFLNPDRKGAHNPAYLRSPALADIENWSPDTAVRLVTLAPELSGALDMIAALAGRGVVVSTGHSAATFEQAGAAFDAGARYATHLFNAMPALHHREPGLVAAVLSDPRITAGLIPDGIHVHPAMVALVWQLLGPSRINLVTDAMAAMGMPPGDYLLGDYNVSVDETSARLADGTLAGCVMALDDILRTFRTFTGASLADAVATVTSTPARLLRLDGQLGRLEPGMAADFVLMTPAGVIVETFVAGKSLYRQA